ncbi:MAG: hypothetical protein RMK29_04200 [Myxococcales bacterium]|nr:hypothetical protein [Myxococcota bacterium]MDW8280889.1 hypothetical protein [Myxococcales bacterium]
MQLRTSFLVGVLLSALVGCAGKTPPPEQPTQPPAEPAAPQAPQEPAAPPEQPAATQTTPETPPQQPAEEARPAAECTSAQDCDQKGSPGKGMVWACVEGSCKAEKKKAKKAAK